MCIATIIINKIKEFPIIILHNREENIVKNKKNKKKNRKTQKPEIINEILYPKDMIKGGTWIGMNVKNKNIAFLTNSFLKENKEDKVYETSRGSLIFEYLKDKESINEFEKRFEDYDGFNIIYGNLIQREFYYYTNIEMKENEIKKSKLKEGINVLSNTYLNDESSERIKILNQMLNNFFDDKSTNQLNDLKSIIL
jgi:uncharacterized protein with NRDE domain